MVATVAISAGLLTTSVSFAANKRTDSGIVGKVKNADPGTRVIATGQDGKTYIAEVKYNGKYKIRHIPPGTYSLKFDPDCTQPWDAGNVVVMEGETARKDTEDKGEYNCIIVGMLTADKTNG